ncbi:MAG: type IV secretory system conjugative DNA transfer family protein [Eubacterium sp.]|jgi:type IV secretion system protein VirD4|nr:type IV secretory system conjugative DNA transfer family protein [Eubacterium sp.]
MRAIGKILSTSGKFAAKTIANSLTSNPVKEPPNAEVLPPVVSRLTLNRDIDVHGFIFGKQQGQTIAKDEQADGHVMVVGGVGSGKSSCIAIPTLLAWNERFFAVDIKGELSDKITDMSIDRLKNIKIFGPSIICDERLGYNPFYLLAEADNQAQEAKAIANALIPLPSSAKEPFWIQSAQNLFSGAILHFFNLGFSFIEMIEKILSTKISVLVEEISTSETREAAFFVNSFADMELKTLSSIFAELSNNIMVFVTDKDIRNALSQKQTISPEDLEMGYDIFLQIPEHLLRQWKNLLTLIVSQFLTHFEKREERSATPILFLLDEFARLGKMEGIVDGLATLRSKKITICIILQSLAQLDLIYGKESRQVIADTCQYKAILSATDAESQEYFSKLVGTYEKYKVINSQQFERFTNFKAGTSITQTTEEKARIKPEEFATLEQIVLFSPFGVFKIDKAPYY